MKVIDRAMSGRWYSVTIEQNSPTQSATGAPVDSWSDFATVYAKIEPGRSREFFSAKATQSELSHEIVIHYLPSVSSAMRIRFGTRYFYLAGPPVNPGEMNQFMVLTAMERVQAPEA